MLDCYAFTKVTKEQLLPLIGDFIYCWGMHFFIETAVGNFIWEDPEYDGANTMQQYSGTFNQFLKFIGVPMGRCKGKHIIRDYCGDKFNVIQRIEHG